MFKSRKIIIVASLILGLGSASCKKFLDVNQNPNVSQRAMENIILPAGQLYLASALGNDLQIFGAYWGQHWTQSPAGSQYIPLEQYIPSQDVFSKAWSNLYAANENFFQLQNLADSQNSKQYAAVALILQAYTFQLLTDGWGDVPFKQALKGQNANGYNTNPKYDSQKVVYNGILSYLDSALRIINPSAGSVPGTDDLVYGGDMTKWIKFANTLKLRVLLRMNQIDPVSAKAGIIALYNTANHSFIGVGDDAVIKFGYSATNRNPLFADAAGLGKVQNFAASRTCIDSMVSNYDTFRMKVFFEPGISGMYTGITQGKYDSAYSTWSIPSYYVGGDVSNSNSGNAPVILLSSWESLFLQAEVIARGYVVTGVPDASLFNQAISANFNYYSSQILATSGIPGATAFTSYMFSGTPGYFAVYPAAGTVTQRVQYIITQKWFAMCGNQSFEAWNEWRRTGFPSWLNYSANTNIGAQFPKRLLYPTSESYNNGNFPGLKPLTSKVWWDVF